MAQSEGVTADAVTYEVPTAGRAAYVAITRGGGDMAETAEEREMQRDYSRMVARDMAAELGMPYVDPCDDGDEDSDGM